MKKLFLFITVLLVFVSSCGKKENQGELIAVISPDKMNILYIGVDNPISIAVPDVDAKDLDVKISEGEITGKDGKYIVKLGDATNTATIEVYVNKDGNKVYIGEYNFRVKPVPPPKTNFGGVTGDGTISFSDLLKVDSIFADLRDFDFNLKFQIVSFNLSVEIDGMTESIETHKLMPATLFIDMPSEGNKLTAEQKELLKKVKPGKRILIEDVKAIVPDGSTRKISGCVIKVQ